MRHQRFDTTLRNLLRRSCVLFVVVTLAACQESGPGGSENLGPPLLSGNFPIAYVKRPVDALGNPTDGIIFRPGGDLFLRDLSSPSAVERNLTSQHTKGVGDVSDPEPSFDGRRILFSMRGPDDPTWNIWEYSLASGRLQRVIRDDVIANLGDDVDPAYLPDGRIVFSSNRQARSKQLLETNKTEPFSYRDEYDREEAIVLHTMNADGSTIEQISFNQSHDRNPTVLQTGEIIFSRWEHVGERNQFSIFICNPDGTSMFVLYGAHSPGNSFLHPREMQDGRLVSSLMPLAGTREGGAIVAIDVQNFSEHDDPAPGVETGNGGQQQVTVNEIPLDASASRYGRYTTPFPLWDDTQRLLVSWTPSREVIRTDPITGAEETVDGVPAYGIYMLDLIDNTLRPVVLANDGIAATDPIALVPRTQPNVVANKTLNPQLIKTNQGILNVKSVYDTDKRERMGKAVLSAAELASPNPNGTGILGDLFDDTAELIRTFKKTRLTAATQRPARFVRVSAAIPTPPGVSADSIGASAFEMQRLIGYAEVEPDGSFKIEVPADTPLTVAALDRSGRAFTPHTNWLQVRPGETRTCNGCHSPRRSSAVNVDPIAGNHPPLFGTNTNGVVHVHPGVSVSSVLHAVDPDGDTLTYRIVDKPLQGTVVITDALTGEFTYTAWDTAEIGQDKFTWVANDGATDSNVATITVNIHEPPQANAGESMAETRVRNFSEVAVLSADIVYQDVWDARTNPCLRVRYTGNQTCLGDPLPGEDLATPIPVDGIINYPDHIQPLWERDRGVNTCVSCHNNTNSDDPTSAGLDLRDIPAASGRMGSYDHLLIGRVRLDEDGLPVITEVDGVPTVEREAALVVAGRSRESYAIEKLFGEELLAPRSLQNRVIHNSFLNAAERRLLVEWIDMGAQFVNDPFGADANGNGIKELSELRNPVVGVDANIFEQTIHPILYARCAGCHKPFEGVGTSDQAVNGEFRANRFILTGSPEGDFNITRAFIDNLTDPAQSSLLRFPASDGRAPNVAHPLVTGQLGANNVPVLSPSAPADATAAEDYRTIVDWINQAAGANGL